MTMSRLLFSVLLVSFMFMAHCKEFSYPKGPSPCILNHMTAAFNLSVSGDMQESVVFDLNDAAVDDSKSFCNDTIDALVIELAEKDELELSFIVGSDNVVSLTMKYTFDARKRFPKSTDNATVTLVSEGIDLVPSNASYLCNVSQTYTFVGNSSDNDYTLELMLSSVHMQAFNLNGGNFSRELECDADNSSISPITKTTEAPKTSAKTTPSKAKTTVAPTHFKYVVKDGDEPCIILNAVIKVNVNYTKENGTTDVVSLAVPSETDGTIVTGKCGANGTDGSMTLSFPTKDNATRTVDFTFGIEENDQVYIENVTVVIDLDKATFPDAMNKTESAKNHVHFQLSTSDNAFKCNSEEDLSVNKIHVKTTQLEVQAFNVNKTFSGTVETCEKDKTTTANPITTIKPSTTTSHPVTTPLPQPPRETYKVTDGNVTCILFQARIQFDITYMLTSGKLSTVKVNAPNDTVASGKCGSGVQELDLDFNDWQLSFYFYSTGKGLQATAGNAKFHLGNMTLRYNLSPDIFPDAANKSEFTVNINLGSSTYEASEGGSYKCGHDRSIKMNANVTVHTTEFQYKAFAKDNSTFSGNGVTECTVDSETNSIVPIAVGAALAALVVIVLIAYLIGRRRRNKGYESV